MAQSIPTDIVHGLGRDILIAILAGFWLKEVAQRFRSDREQWRNEPKMRPAIGFVWALSALAILWFVSMGYWAVWHLT